MSDEKLNIRQILCDESTSWWLKYNYKALLDKDIVDAINDVEVLLAMLQQDFEEMLAKAKTEV